MLAGGVLLMLGGCQGGSNTPPAPSTAPAPRPAATAPGAPPPRTIAAASTAPGTLSAPSPASAVSGGKISPRLRTVAGRVAAAATGTQAAALSSAMVRVNHRREIQVYIHVSRLSPALEKAIAGAGASDVRASPALGLYQAWATPAAIERIAGLSGVTRVAPPVYGFPQHGQ